MGNKWAFINKKERAYKNGEKVTGITLKNAFYELTKLFKNLLEIGKGNYYEKILDTW